MSYDTAEDSIDSSEPVYLYEYDVFGAMFRYTGSDRDITFESQLYVHIEGMKHTDIIDDGKLEGGVVEIYSRQDFYIATLFDPYPPDQDITVKIRRLQVNENEANDVWVGSVDGVQWPEGASKQRCQHAISALKRKGLRRKIQVNCGYSVYGISCKADPAPHTTPITIATVSGRHITSPDLDALDDGYGSGGLIMWENPVGRPNWRGAWNHVGSGLDLTYPAALEAGMVVNLRRGCDHTASMCNDVFGNIRRHGGFKFFVGKNPYDGRVQLF